MPLQHHYLRRLVPNLCKHARNAVIGATVPDDPLIVGASGQGECPVCGVIVARYTSIQEASRGQESASAPRIKTPSQSSKSDAKRYYGRPILIMLFGVVMLFLGFSALLDLTKAADWKSTQGHIQRVWETSHTTRTSSGQRKTSHSYHVKYDYTVDGTVYSSQRVSFAPAFFSIAYQWIYTSGQGVTVYYDPADPSEAVLVRSFTIEHLVALAIGGGLIVWGFITIYRIRSIYAVLSAPFVISNTVRKISTQSTLEIEGKQVQNAFQSDPAEYSV